MSRPLAFLSLAAAVALLAGLAGPPPAPAQVKPVEENFTTADGVRLRGLFHRSPRPAEGDPVVVLLYPPGPGHSMDSPGDWAGLTATLNGKGFHVFRFDWRGHGKSTDITDPDEFWNRKAPPFTATGIWNQKYVKGLKDKPVRNTLSVQKDIDPRYFPVYVNDLCAARMHLDAKNDLGLLNTSSVYLIGAGDTATLGLLWMAAEWLRPAIHPMLGGGRMYTITPTKVVVNPPAGADIAGAVWLSATRPPQVKEKVLEGWVDIAPKMRANNPMLFLYGAQEPAKPGADGKFFFEHVLTAGGSKTTNPLDQTFLTPISGTRLSGVDLIGKGSDLSTRETILRYLAARQKDRVSVVRKERKYVTPYYINLAHFGLYPDNKK
jgi:hypothetical protein